MDLPDWVQRSERAYLNMLENLPVFAAIVLVVHSSGAANVTTALGAQIFFGDVLPWPLGIWAEFQGCAGPTGL